jgi:hypothetical protein
LPHATSEFALHADDHALGDAAAFEVVVERGQHLRKSVDARCVLIVVGALIARALVLVRVPAAVVERRDLEADVVFGDVRDELRLIRERRAWPLGRINRTRRRRVVRKVERIDERDGFRGADAREVERARTRVELIDRHHRRTLVERLTVDLRAAVAVRMEARRIVERHRVAPSEEAERRRRARCERGNLRVVGHLPCRFEMAREPPGFAARQARRAEIAIVLRVEMTARDLVDREADAVHDRELAARIEIVQPRRREVEAELGVERKRRGVAGRAQINRRPLLHVRIAIRARDRRDETQPVHAAAQEQVHDEVAASPARARIACVKAEAKAAGCTEADRRTLEERAARQMTHRSSPQRTMNCGLNRITSTMPRRRLYQ